MTTLETVNRSLARISELPEGLVALFLGATSGIGQSALKQLAEHAVRPRVYIVARKAAATNELLDSLRQVNPEGTYIVIEKDVSLIQQTDEAVEFVKSKETKLDFLFLSVGFISFDGRQETAEGLDASMSTRYYSRVRAIQTALPLLKAARHPRVVNVLAGGQEGKMNEQDLDLRQPGNYSIAGAAGHSGTMLTLALEHFAKENPEISFVHAFPGLVSTPLLTRGSSGLVKILLQWVVTPLLSLFTMKPQDAGARVLFYAVSDQYAVNNRSDERVDGLPQAPRSAGGVFLVNEKSAASGDEKLLADFRARGVDESVWKHTQDIFSAITGSRA